MIRISIEKNYADSITFFVILPILFAENSRILFIKKLFLEYFFHCFSFCEFIDEFIEIPDITHELIFDFRYFVSTDTPGDEYSIWIENWGFSEKCLEINIFFEYFFESVRIISCEPEYDLIDLGLCSSLFLCFGDIERIDPCDWHGEYFGVLHSD